MTRVAGQSMARMAEAQVAAALERAQGSGPAGGSALMRSIDIEIVPKLEVILGYVWRRHLLAAAWRQFAAADAPDNGAEMAVGFADLVGFTALSQQLRPSELAAVVDRFEVLVYEHVPERHGRVVKMIGDEAMFVADDMTAAAEIALGLVEAHAAEEMLPELRVGLAFGSALSWEGDYFGATVNLASRLVNVARPGTILVSERAAELLRDNPAFLLRPMRPLHLKGIGRSRVAALRRAGDPGRKPSGSRPAG
jgi:adenylate cyclase